MAFIFLKFWSYKQIPSQNFVSYLREAGFKVKNAKKNHYDIIKGFFGYFVHNMNLKGIIIEDK